MFDDSVDSVVLI